MTVEAEALLEVADTAIDLVVEKITNSTARSTLDVETKSSRTDMVTSMDRWTERTLVESISATRPDDGFLGEEGTSKDSISGVTWLIDPIDGTTNFVYDLPGYSISVAASLNGIVVAGAVHDPVRGERFRAVLGGGASRDHKPIQVSNANELSTALVATGFSYDSRRRFAQAEVLTRVLPLVRDIRRLGGAAIDLCSVACGRVDAYYERGLSPWDMAAGALIASEAGAGVSGHVDGVGALMAASPGIFDALAELLEQAGAHTA